jgi:hypothetical protein
MGIETVGSGLFDRRPGGVFQVRRLDSGGLLRKELPRAGNQQLDAPLLQERVHLPLADGQHGFEDISPVRIFASESAESICQASPSSFPYIVTSSFTGAGAFASGISE